MKLIIEISEEDYNNIEPFLNGETIKGGFNLFKTLEIIKNGIPLDSISTISVGVDGKAVQIYPNNAVLDHLTADLEALREPTEPHLVDYRYHRNDMLDMVLRVIERYRNEVSK